jgi:hypothetical protein
VLLVLLSIGENEGVRIDNRAVSINNKRDVISPPQHNRYIRSVDVDILLRPWTGVKIIQTLVSSIKRNFDVSASLDG